MWALYTAGAAFWMMDRTPVNKGPHASSPTRVPAPSYSLLLPSPNVDGVSKFQASVSAPILFPQPRPEINTRMPCYDPCFPNGGEDMVGEYSLSDLLERIYHNQLALEAAIMELTLSAEARGLTDVGENV